jgi:hypothetical protein
MCGRWRAVFPWLATGLLAAGGGCAFQPVILAEAGVGGEVDGGPRGQGTPPAGPIIPVGLDAGDDPAVPVMDAAGLPDGAGAMSRDAEATRPADAGGTPPDARVAADAPGSPPTAPQDASPPADRPPPPDAPTSPPLPGGCAVAACDGAAGNHSCCRAWYYFALDSEDRGQVQRNELVTSFVKDTDVRASYAFDRAGQDGAVGMLLDRPRRPGAIRVTSSWAGNAARPPFVTVEATDGAAGCGYPLSASGQADLGRPMYCWGSPSLLPDRINIRIEAPSPGAASIRVTGLDVR